MKKLNLGCGQNYKEGFVNLDFDKSIKADVYTDIEKSLPFDDDYFDYVYANHILEHIPRDKFYFFMEELSRICKKDARIEVFVPHFTSITATKLIYHHICFGVGSFNMFDLGKEDRDIGRYCKARFKVDSEELHLVFEKLELSNYKWIRYFRWTKIFFNFNRIWKILMERFFIFGFDEIKYVLIVEK